MTQTWYVAEVIQGLTCAYHWHVNTIPGHSRNSTNDKVTVELTFSNYYSVTNPYINSGWVYMSVLAVKVGRWVAEDDMNREKRDEPKGLSERVRGKRTERDGYMAMVSVQECSTRVRPAWVERTERTEALAGAWVALVTLITHGHRARVVRIRSPVDYSTTIPTNYSPRKTYRRYQSIRRKKLLSVAFCGSGSPNYTASTHTESF